MAVATSEIAKEPTSTGALEVPEVADTSAMSIAEGVLKDLGDTPLIPEKPKRGRPKKTKSALEVLAEAENEDAGSAPLAEPDDGDEPETEETPEATEGIDDKEEPTELEDQLSALAQNYGVDPELLKGTESVAEAERLINKLYTVFYREGSAPNGQAQNGNAGQQQTTPAAPTNGAVQKPAAAALDIDLSVYDDDEPIKKHLQTLIERDKAREAEVAEFRAEKNRIQEAEFHRVQYEMAHQLQNEFFSASPELFGTPKKQDPVQAKRMKEAFAIADKLIAGHASMGEQLPPMQAIAKWAVNSKFADDLANQKIKNKSATIQQRTARRSVGAPAQVGRSASNAPKAKEHEGPITEDPDILAAVTGILSRSRA